MYTLHGMSLLTGVSFRMVAPIAMATRESPNEVDARVDRRDAETAITIPLMRGEAISRRRCWTSLAGARPLPFSTYDRLASSPGVTCQVR